MNNRKKYKRTAIITLVLSLVILVALNIIFSFLYVRIDLTAEKRNSIARSTIKLLKSLDDDIYIKVYLKGKNNPADYQIFAQKTKEILEEFSRYSSKFQFEMIDPIEGKDQEEITSIFGEFSKKGLYPVPLSREDYSTTWVVPGAMLHYRTKEYPITLVVSDPNGDRWLDFSIQELEYNLVSAIRNITTMFAPKVAFLEGHGELNRIATAWMEWQLKRYYVVDRVTIDNKINSLREVFLKDSVNVTLESYGNKFDVLIVAQPTMPFSDMDKYVIDQFIMNGGKVLWLIDATNASVDSLQNRGEFFATENNLRLNTLFFKYGVRMNANLIQDLINYQSIPLATGVVGNQPQLSFYAFPYMFVGVNFSTHPIVRNINALKVDFAGTIDFVGLDSELRKTILVTTSEKTKVVPTPSIVTLNVIKVRPNSQEFSRMREPIAVLVEGKFTSAFKGLLPVGFDTIQEFKYKEESRETRQIFISDGDMIRNRYDYKSMETYPTGYDTYSKKRYDNADFLLNCVNYLSADDELLTLRAKNFKIGTLNPVAIKEKKKFYTVLNTIGPLLLISLMAAILIFFRKWKYNLIKN